jgi:hypothetical protein
MGANGWCEGGPLDAEALGLGALRRQAARPGRAPGHPGATICSRAIELRACRTLGPRGCARLRRAALRAPCRRGDDVSCPSVARLRPRRAAQPVQPGRLPVPAPSCPVPAAHAPPTVADTKKNFLDGYRRPIPAIYNTVVQELLVQQHFIRYNVAYQYNEVGRKREGC